MNPTTQQSQMQDQQDPSKATNQAAANLGFINTMQEHLLEHTANKNRPASPQNAPQSTQEVKQDNPTEGKKELKTEPNMAEEFTKFKTEIEGLMDSKLGDLKREIETALQDEGDLQNKSDEQKTEVTKTT